MVDEQLNASTRRWEEGRVDYQLEFSISFFRSAPEGGMPQESQTNESWEMLMLVDAMLGCWFRSGGNRSPWQSQMAIGEATKNSREASNDLVDCSITSAQGRDEDGYGKERDLGGLVGYGWEDLKV